MSEIFENPDRGKTVGREAIKWLLVRLLPKSVYQRVLARTKARDLEQRVMFEPEQDLVSLAAGPGAVAVDIGANHGMWVREMSLAVGEAGRVLAFEPVPNTFLALEALVRHLGMTNVELVRAGCAEQTGRFEMVVPRQSSGAADDKVAHLATRGDREGERVECEIVRLDDRLAGLDRLDLIKVDVEGAEMDALQGAAGLLARHRPVVISEVDSGFLAGFGHTNEEFFDFMADLGYEPWRLSAGDGLMRRVDQPEQIRHANVVFVPPARRDAFARVLG